MNDDETPTSFDALAHEMNLSPRMRDLNRIFFKDGLEEARTGTAVPFAIRCAEHNLGAAARGVARAFRDLGSRKGAAQVLQLRGNRREAGYNHVLDRDTATGEFG